eukprot:479711_1
MDASRSNYMISPITSVLEESLLKLELLKLICHNDTTTLRILLKDTDGAAPFDSVQQINDLMNEHLSILSDPDLEWTANTITLLDSVKENINRQFHQTYIESMKQINKTSLTIHEIITLNKENDDGRNGKWENIANSFIKYLKLAKNTFQDLSQQHKSKKTAETAQETIHRLVQKYKKNKLQFDDLESILNKDREYRQNIRNDMTFNINKLQNDINSLQTQYDKEEKALSEHEIHTNKYQTENHDKTVKHRNSEIEKTTAKLAQTKAANFDLEVEIKKKVKRLENEIDEIKNKYNTDMISISQESEKLTKLNESETNRLNELQIKINELKKEREEHEKELQEQRDKEEKLKQMCEDAAICIQKIWKGFKTRKSIKNKGDKKKDKAKKKRNEKKKRNKKLEGN